MTSLPELGKEFCTLWSNSPTPTSLATPVVTQGSDDGGDAVIQHSNCHMLEVDLKLTSAYVYFSSYLYFSLPRTEFTIGGLYTHNINGLQAMYTTGQILDYM